jgi:hypothetical protein
MQGCAGNIGDAPIITCALIGCRRPRRATQPVIEPVRTCSNCGSSRTPGGLWRRGLGGETLCNKCGLYAAHHEWQPRPVHRPHPQ